MTLAVGGAGLSVVEVPVHLHEIVIVPVHILVVGIFSVPRILDLSLLVLHPVLVQNLGLNFFLELFLDTLEPALAFHLVNYFHVHQIFFLLNSLGAFSAEPELLESWLVLSYVPVMLFFSFVDSLVGNLYVFAERVFLLDVGLAAFLLNFLRPEQAFLL